MDKNINNLNWSDPNSQPKPSKPNYNNNFTKKEINYEYNSGQNHTNEYHSVAVGPDQEYELEQILASLAKICNIELTNPPTKILSTKNGEFVAPHYDYLKKMKAFEGNISSFGFSVWKTKQGDKLMVSLKFPEQNSGGFNQKQE